MKMKRKLIICAIVIVFILVLLPLPQKVERKFFGENISNGEKISIAIDLNYLRFLLLPDKMYGEITVTSGNKSTVFGEHLSYAGRYPTNNEDKTIHAFTGFRYDADENTIMSAGIFLSRDFDKILVRDDETEYIGNVAENKEEETAAYFVGYTRR